MKARIKATGELINIAEYATIQLDKCDSYGNPIEVKPDEIELVNIDAEDEKWKELRECAAISAMQGIMNFFGSLDYNRDTIAKLAVEQANALIDILKKEANEISR